MGTELFVTMFMFVCFAQIEAQLRPDVIGYIDGVRNTTIVGWACQKTLPRSLLLHLYVGDSMGHPDAVFLKPPRRANRRSEMAVAKVCRIKKFRSNRFRINLTLDEVREHGN